MTPQIRKLMLTTHVICTVGWMGAIAAFLALAATGLNSRDSQMVSSAYLAMKLVGWKVIVPLGVASLLTGLVQSLGTSWGLFRHYWVLVKLLLTVVATVLLLLHMALVNRLADRPKLSDVAHLQSQRIHITADAAAAVLLLIVTTALSIYKPRGLTQYGSRKQREEYRVAGAESAGSLEMEETSTPPLWVKIFGVAALVVLVLFRAILVHVAGGEGHHFH